MNKENCKDSYNNFKRARYFHGMLMTDRDFTEEQRYQIEKRKLHNRMLHGWGVVCGLKISASNPAGNSVIIEKGLALDCNGNEIFVNEPIEFDVQKAIEAFNSTESVKQDCESQNKKSEDPNTYYVIIKYKELRSDAVPVYAPGSGCEEKVCEYSRIREGFCIDVTQTRCSKPNNIENLCIKGKDMEDDAKDSFYCYNLIKTYPEVCCNDQYIYLGSITVNKPIKKIEDKMINNCDCSRFVITLG